MGSGDKEDVYFLRVATPDTVQHFGRVDEIFVAGEQEMTQHYQQQGAVTSLIPPVLPTNQNVTPANFAIVMPVPNGIVHYFADCPYPYIGLMQIQ